MKHSGNLPAPDESGGSGTGGMCDLDDVIVYSDTWKEHLFRLRALL